MDSAAIVGFVAALLGAAAGALGTYYATVGAAAQQGRARVRAALEAVRTQAKEHSDEAASISERLQRQQRQLSLLVAAVRAVAAGQPPMLGQQTLDPDSDADLSQLLGGRLDLGFVGVSAAAWSTVLAPDAAHVPPGLYGELVGYEAFLDAIRDMNAQGVPLLFGFYALFSEPPEPTLRALAEVDARSGGELLSLARRIIVLCAALSELQAGFQRQREQLQARLG